MDLCFTASLSATGSYTSDVFCNIICVLQGEITGGRRVKQIRLTNAYLTSRIKYLSSQPTLPGGKGAEGGLWWNDLSTVNWTYPRWFQWVRRGVSAPAVLDEAAEPPLDPAEVVHVVHVGLRQRNVTNKVFEAGLLLIERLDLSPVIVHVTFIRWHPTVCIINKSRYSDILTSPRSEGQLEVTWTSPSVSVSSWWGRQCMLVWRVSSSSSLRLPRIPCCSWEVMPTLPGPTSQPSPTWRLTRRSPRCRRRQ